MDWVAWGCARVLNLDCRLISVALYYTTTQWRKTNAAPYQKTRETRPTNRRLALHGIRRLWRLGQTHSIAALNLAVLSGINSRSWVDFVTFDFFAVLAEIEIPHEAVTIEQLREPYSIIVPHLVVWNQLDREPFQFSFVAPPYSSCRLIA